MMRAKQEIAAVFFAFIFFCGFSFLSDIKNEKGNEFYKKGQVGKAKSEYLGAMKSDPKSPEIAYNLGNALYKEGSFKESLSAYQKAVNTQKDADFQAKVFYNHGNSLYRNQDLPKAIESYKQALRLNPRDEDAKYNLELLLKQMPKNQDQKKDQQKEQQKQDQPKQNQDQQQKQNESGGSGDEGEKQNPSGEGQQQQGKIGEKQDSSGSGEQQDQKDQKEEAKDNQGQGNEPDKQYIPGPEQAKPKSDADIRAEQLLSALENQEQQVLKFQNKPDNPQTRGRRVAEKDW